MASEFRRGDFVRVGAHLGVVTHLYQELDGFDHDDLEDEHIGIWYGHVEGGRPKVRSVPAVYCELVTDPIQYH